MFFLSTQMSDYKNRVHEKQNGRVTSRSRIDAENEQRARYILSQHFRCNVDVFSSDSHCLIDFEAKSPTGETLALFEFKKRGGNHDDWQYKRGYWLPLIKLDGLVKHGIHERKEKGLPYVTNLIYCWGFNDVMLYINVQKEKIWHLPIVTQGTNYKLNHRSDGGQEPFHLIPCNHPGIKAIQPHGFDMPWRYAEEFHPWVL